VAGPFKGMRAKITRIEAAKQEITVVLIDTPYQMPITLDGGYVKVVAKAPTVEPKATADSQSRT
jgi:transcription termination/antitermination protein NusG